MTGTAPVFRVRFTFADSAEKIGIEWVTGLTLIDFQEDDLVDKAPEGGVSHWAKLPEVTGEYDVDTPESTYHRNLVQNQVVHAFPQGTELLQIAAAFVREEGE
ncbi:hypothetical protein GSI_11989 [Ganoderma sinense ZZ0214-1]|uniref:Uncharacterized protein n=1 Tax=Ganoderma sinense ZZ0214-1 TaxID=1077348 RepID=A0A2G8RXL5_9APHY|nr:hypothetical protein GSI_11989 [Ganoderma sinense ZZ0214-1]